MSTLYLLFSHTLTQEQQQDAAQNLGVDEFVPLPADLQQRFSQVPAHLEGIANFLQPILDWIDTHCTDYEDYILIQGDFGATYFLVDYCKKMDYARPVYATTERKSIDTQNEDGSISTRRIFKHIRFRNYGS